MSGPSHVAEQPIERRAQLVEYLAAGSRPAADWKIGTEHEKFVFRTDDLRPPPYDGERGIGALLQGIAGCGWEPVVEDGNLIALARDKASVTLEPAGQLELSGAPLENIHQTCCEVQEHLECVRRASVPLQLGILGMGFQPKWRRDEMPWMPKGRYKIMRDYMPKVGSLGLDMMTRTCTVQVNLDFGSEADMVKKFRVSLALQPIATALFADSPFTDGQPNGYLSYRSHIWTDTDPGPHRHARLRVRGRLRLRALRRLPARRADVLRASRRALRRRGRAVVPRFPRRQAVRAAGRKTHAARLVRPPDHRVPGSAPEAVPGNARRRRWSMEPAVRVAGVLGGIAV